MALPTNTTSTAGTTNQAVYTAGSKGYTGLLNVINSTPVYYTDYVNNGVNATLNANNPNSSGGGGAGGGGRGISLPSLNLTGLDKALGVLGALAALEQLPGMIKNAVGAIKGIAQSIVNTGKALLASAKRLLNLPKAIMDSFSSIGDSFKGTFTDVSPNNPWDWRVRINTNFSVFGSPLLAPLIDTKGMVFPFVPSIMVNHKANYTVTEPLHSNFAFQGYKNSSVEDITITGEFAVQTEEEGQYWLAATTFLRSATKMFYGNSTPQGNPPIVCRLTGYGDYVFNNVPVVIKNFQLELPKDTNYKKIMTKNGSPAWVPMTSSITVVVSPVYNRAKLRSFSLQDYANGTSKGVM
jgi:hypothetical protein